MSSTNSSSTDKAAGYNVPMYYLFRAEVDPAGAVVKGSMEPVGDQLFLSEDTRLSEDKRADAPLTVWCTDETGLIRAVNTQKSHGDHHVRINCPDPLQVIFPPTELALYAYAAQGQSWTNALAGAVHDAVSAKKLAPLVRKCTRFTGKELAICLRPPATPEKGEEDTDQLYRQWYEKYTADPAKEMLGFILPQVRAIFFIFTSKLYNDAKVTFWPPDRKRDGKDKGIKVDSDVAGDADQTGGQGTPSRFWLTCHSDRVKVLKTGIYTIEVTIEKARTIEKAKANSSFADSKTLLFKTYVTFETTNAAGTYAVVPCDPVSVEEAMMVQFPKELAHLLTAARRSNVETDKLSGDLPEAFSQAIPQGLKPWSERLKLSKSVLGDAASVLEADSATDLFKLLGDKLWRVLEKSAEKDVRAWVELGFGVRDALEGWKDVREKIKKLTESAQTAKKLQAMEKARPLADLLKMIQQEGFKGLRPGKIADTWAQSHEKWTFQKIDTEKNKVIEACTRKSYAKKLNAITKWAGKGLTVYALYDGITTASETATSAEKANTNFEKLCQEYVKQICEPAGGGQSRHAKDYTFYPCREAASNLEKMRNRAIILDLKLDEDQKKAMMALHDAVLMGMTFIPAAAEVAGVVMVVESGGKLVWDFGKTLGTWADQVAFDNALSEYLSERKMFADLADYHAVNFRRLEAKGMQLDQADLPENHVHLQYRLRAEVVHGLFWLIAFCATNLDGTNTLESNLERYKVQQYIRNYLLNDGWAYSLITSIDRNVYKIWLHMINHGNPMQSQELEEMGLDSNYLLIQNPQKDRQGLQSLRGGFYDGSIVKDYSKHKLLRPATFQNCFPIQVMDSDDVTDLAKSFKTIHKELDADCLAYSEIYFRKRGETEKSIWRPMMDVIRKIDGAPQSLSPFHQIRVLIVLKKENEKKEPIKGIYPVELQLMRTDGYYNFKGPTYTGITRMLMPADSPNPEAKTWEWAGYCGCIIEPFFSLYGAYMPGTKPMAGETAMGFLQGWFPGNRQPDTDTADEYYQRGHLSNMRYGFKMKIGNNEKTQQWVRVRSRVVRKKSLSQLDQRSITGGVDEGSLAHIINPPDRRMDYPVSVDKQRRHGFDANGLRVYQDGPDVQWVSDEDKLLSKHLLTSRTESATYPPLFFTTGELLHREVFAIPLMRLGDGEYMPPLNGFEKDLAKVSIKSVLEPEKTMACRLGFGAITETALEVQNFDWHTPVSFIILVAVANIDTSAYEKQGLDWRTIPFETTLVELTGSNTSGPKLSTRMHYVGKAQALDSKFVLSEQEKIPWESFSKLMPIKNLVENSELLNALHMPLRALGQQFHLYAAYLQMEYDAPTGAAVKSIRPFGGDRVAPATMLRADKPYKFAFRNLRTVDDSGLAMKYLCLRGAVSHLQEFEFHFSGLPAGWAYDNSNLPWMKPPQPPLTAKTVDLAAIKTWIEEKPESVKLVG